MKAVERDAEYWTSGPSAADVDAARNALARRARFRSVVDGAVARLHTMGLTVPLVSVQNVLAVQTMALAAQLDITPLAALEYARPDALARSVASASGGDARPARVPGRRSILPVLVCGRVVEALAQTAKFALANGEARIAEHAVDLVSELGAALRQISEGDDEVTADAGIFAEAATLLDQVAGHLQDGGWSSCPCGQDHRQAEQDAAVVPHLRVDADLARMIANSAA